MLCARPLVVPRGQQGYQHWAQKRKGSDHREESVAVSYDSVNERAESVLIPGTDGAVWCMYTAQLDRMEGKA